MTHTSAFKTPEKEKALVRALLPDFKGELVPQCNHDMCFRQRRIVDARGTASKGSTIKT